MTQIAADALGLPVGAVRAGGGRHRPHRRRRQDLGLAPDLRLGQGGASCAGRDLRAADPAARQCRRGGARWRSRAGARACATAARCARSTCGRWPAATADCWAAAATSIRRPRRSTPTARACPTRPTPSPRRSPTVEVDTELGTVKVLRIVAAHDVGRAINPTLVEGQIHGGIAQGLGLALMEEYLPGPHREPARLPDPDRRRRARDRMHPDRGSRAARALTAPRASASRRWCRRRRRSWAPSTTRPACGLRVPFTPDRLRAAILAKEAACGRG